MFIKQIQLQGLKHNNTYLQENLSRNQLRCCNVPPNHRPVCSSISQHHIHLRVGHDFHKELGNNKLTHSKTIHPQLSQHTVGFHRRLRQQANNIWVPWTYSSMPTITPKHIQPYNIWVPWPYSANPTPG